MKQQYPKLKVILSVGGGSGKINSSFVDVAYSGCTRKKFAINARNIVDLYGLDGIDSTFLHPD